MPPDGAIFLLQRKVAWGSEGRQVQLGELMGSAASFHTATTTTTAARGAAWALERPQEAGLQCCKGGRVLRGLTNAMKSASATRSPNAAESSSYGFVSEFMWMKKSKSRCVSGGGDGGSRRWTRRGWRGGRCCISLTCRMSRARREHDWRRSHLISISSVISPGCSPPSTAQ